MLVSGGVDVLVLEVFDTGGCCAWGFDVLLLFVHNKGLVTIKRSVGNIPGF
jgi:hypothetical protein